MNEKLKIAVFIDYDNIEIGVKSTLQRDLDVAALLDALKERGDIVAKFAYADWGRQEGAKRQMAENAVQMVQRIPSPRGDKNGADINLALDALEMAFTHGHVNAFAIVSGDSDFIPLLNKLKEYGKTVFVVGGRAFTSTILQRNCHEFISFESLWDEPPRQSRPAPRGDGKETEPPPPPPPPPKGPPRQQQPRQPRRRPPPLDLAQAMPLVERALHVLERREVTPQLGLLKSTMLQLNSTFTERAYGAGSFSEFVEKLKAAGYVNVSGGEGRYVIERKTKPEEPAPKPEEALPLLRDFLETHRLELDAGCLVDDLAAWVRESRPEFDCKRYGFQEFTELLNFAQDKLLVRLEPDEEKGLLVYLGAEFYPPALPEAPATPLPEEEKQPESNESAPLVIGAPKRKRAPRRKSPEGAAVRGNRAAGRRGRRKPPAERHDRTA
jgi:uncharacterized protein (TIGR00288 family)